MQFTLIAAKPAMSFSYLSTAVKFFTFSGDPEVQKPTQGRKEKKEEIQTRSERTK